MGRHFGDLAVIRGIIYYKLSPHEQKPFATAFIHGIPNFIPRSLSNMYTWLPSAIIGYITYSMVDESYRLSKKKNPFDFINEKPPIPPPEEICKAK